jgi:hypothetical protein
VSSAELLVSMEWLLTIALLSAFGYASVQWGEQVYSLALQSPVVIWLTTPTLETLVKLLGG